MTWQFFLVSFLLLSVVAELLRRRLGQSIPQYNRLVNAFFFIGIHYPAGLAAAYFIGFDLNIGWFNALALFVAGILFPLSGMMAFRASKDVDAGLFGILSNLKTVVTLILAAWLLSERLTPQQFIGALIIILSALLVTTISYSHSSRSTKKGVLLAVFTVVLMGIETVYEAWMLQRIGLGSYLVYGWGLQTLWMAVFAWPQRKYIKKIINRRYGTEVFVLSVARSLKGFAILSALAITHSASVVGAFTSFLPVMVVAAGFLFLGERKYLKLKFLAAVAGTIGLLILSLSKSY